MNLNALHSKLKTRIYDLKGLEIIMYKTGVINDPLGQPTVPAGSDCGLILKFWDGRTDILCEIVITTGRNWGRPRGTIILWTVRFYFNLEINFSDN